MKNKYIRWGGVLLAIIIAFFVYRYINDRQVFARLDEGGSLNYPVSRRQYEAYTKNLDSRYMNDQYGSTTPEGTLDLFVAALEKEDVVLAAKYFVAEKQKKMEEELGMGLRSGGVKTMLNYMNEYWLDKTYIDYMNEYRFHWTDKDDVSVIINFRLNKFTQKWKIENL